MGNAENILTGILGVGRRANPPPRSLVRDMAGGTARGVGNVAGTGVGLYFGIPWFWNNSGIVGKSLMIGSAVAAITIATRGVNGLIKNASRLAVAGFLAVGGYSLYRAFTSAAAPKIPVAPNVTVNPLGEEDALRAGRIVNKLNPDAIPTGVDPALERAAKAAELEKAAELDTSNPAKNVTGVFDNAGNPMTTPIADKATELSPSRIPAVQRTRPLAPFAPATGSLNSIDTAPLTRAPIGEFDGIDRSAAPQTVDGIDTAHSLISEEPVARSNKTVAPEAPAVEDALNVTDNAKARAAYKDGVPADKPLLNAAEGVSQIVEDSGMAALRSERTAEATALKGGRVSANLPIGGTALGVAVGGYIAYNLPKWAEMDRVFADSLVASDDLTPLAAAKFKEVSGEIQNILMTDLGISTADWTGFASLPITAGAEYAAYTKFQTWLDKYAPDLDPALAKELSMSLLTPDTIRSEIISDFIKEMPVIVTNNTPAILRPAIAANAALTTALKDYRKEVYRENEHLYRGFTALGTEDLQLERQYLLETGNKAKLENLDQFISLKENVESARSDFQTSVVGLISQPDGFKTALSVVDSPKVHLGYIDRFAKSETSQLKDGIESANARMSDITETFSKVGQRGMAPSTSEVQSIVAHYNLTEAYGTDFFDNMTPEKAQTILKQERALKEETISTAQSSFTARIDDLASRHPTVAEYIRAKNDEKWLNHRAPRRELLDNPQRMDAYLVDRLDGNSAKKGAAISLTNNSPVMDSSEIRRDYTLATDPASLSDNHNIEPTEPLKVVNSTPALTPLR